MSMSDRHSAATPFFLKAGSGERFCLYHAPNPEKECRGSLIYVHPFAEEMNKSRRMAALQARAFAGMGFGVLQIDLLGCGDSSGEFRDARWEGWKDDISLAAAWLTERTPGPIGIWGLRLGAMLALDFAMQSPVALDTLVLWQPVLNGETFLTQFLRMRMASDMLSGGDQKSAGTKEMRAAIAAGEILEIAGHELAPALAAAIDRMNAADLVVPGIPVHWLELVPEAGRPMSPASARVASAWEKAGVTLNVHLVPGSAFWATQEITECPALIGATTNLFDEVLS